MIVSYFDSNVQRWIFNVPCTRTDAGEFARLLRNLRAYRNNINTTWQTTRREAEQAEDISADVEAVILRSLAERFPATDEDIKHGNLIIA